MISKQWSTYDIYTHNKLITVTNVSRINFYVSTKEKQIISNIHSWGYWLRNSWYDLILDYCFQALNKDSFRHISIVPIVIYVIPNESITISDTSFSQVWFYCRDVQGTSNPGIIIMNFSILLIKMIQMWLGRFPCGICTWNDQSDTCLYQEIALFSADPIMAQH